MHARKTRPPVRPRVRVREREAPETRHAPRQYRPENGFFRLADPAFWGFLPRYTAPQPPFLTRWPPFPRKNRLENPAPVCFFPRSARLFRPICARSPRHSAPDRAPVCGFPPGGSAFCPGNAPRRPIFSPATPHTARLLAPVTPALPAPAHPPGFRAPATPAFAPPRHRLRRFAVVKDCVTPRGPRIPGRSGWRPPPRFA